MSGLKGLVLLTDLRAGAGGIERFNRQFFDALSSSEGVTSLTVLPRIWSSAFLPDTALSPGGGEGLGEGESSRKPVEFIHPLGAREGKPGSRIGYFFSLLTLVLKKKKFDFIFCGHLRMVFLTALLAKIAKCRLWLQLHGVEAWHKPSNLIRWGAEQADWVTSVSRYTRRKFLEWANVAPEKVRVLPNTVDERFSPGPKPVELIKRCGLEEKKILLTVSRLSAGEHYKGQDRVIQIMPRLLQEHPNLIYVIAGDGDDRPRLETLAHEKGVDGCIRFIGKVPESELPDLYRMADLFVMPSSGEGFGISFLEAAASGLPVIGGNQDGSVDALQEGKMGQIVDPNNSVSLIQAILRGLDSNHFQKTESATPFSKERFSAFVDQLLLTLEGRN